MEYLNVTIAFTRSAEYIGSEPTDRGSWLNLAAYCALIENGGVIENCRGWKDRRCQQVLGITRAEMLRECELWSWDGNDLHVHFYPAEQEAKVIRKRGVARHNGKLGGRPRKTESGSDLGSENETHGKPKSVPILEPKREPISEPKSESVKEGKEKEGKGSTTTPPRAELALSLIEAYARPSFDRPALEAAAESLRRFDGKFSFDQIREAVARVTVAVALWPEDERILYLPTAANFFQNDGWRKHPDEWASKRTVKARTNGHKPGLTDEERAARLGGRA